MIIMATTEIDTKNGIILQRLDQLCLPNWKANWKARLNTHVLRAEGPEYAKFMEVPPNAKWSRAFQQLQAGIRRGGDQADISRRKLSLGSFDFGTGRTTGRALTPFLQCVAALLFDQECSGNEGNLER
jgi:hypothetical protein